MKILSVAFFTFLLSLSSFSQGPVDGYMKNKKDYAIGLSASREKAGALFTGTETIAAGRTTYAFSLFAIYGISDRLNVQANIPYLNVNKGTETDFQDASLYVKYLVLKKDNKYGNFNLMAAAGYAHPLTDYQLSGGSAIGQQAKTGDFRIIAQQNLKNKYFVSLQGGYFLKSNPTPNAFSSSIKVGYAGKIYADVWFETMHAFGGTDYQGVGDLEPTAARGGFQGLGFSFNKIGGTVFYPISKHFGAFGGLSFVLSGRNAFRNTGINLGFVIQ
ncbi:MAG: hypothetical protein ABF242_08600 [Flavobacteriales bacterium]